MSASLPARPVVFHGRDQLLNETARLIATHVTARIAILGSGGMGKTTVALAIMHHPDVVDRFGNQRLFLSCEALIDADSIIVSLAKLLGLPASQDLLNTVVTHLTKVSRTILVLDNLETVWLAGGTSVAAVDKLLGRLAQIPTLSLIITCRGTDLPQSVEWSNPDTSVLEPFSLEAALETFQDRAGHRLSSEDKTIASQLLSAVDMMPLAVSLLGQLSRRGNSVSNLLARWNRERTSLLGTHGTGRFNNVEVSIELSIAMLRAADVTNESLQLLSLCSMLPDGLHQGVFERLRPHFQYIDRGRDNLFAYSLVSLASDGAIITLSPVRHHVLNHYPPQPEHHKALCSIYFDIAQQLPITVNEHFKNLVAAAAPEMNNLSTLLLTLVERPSLQVVEAVLCFTRSAYLQHPTLAVALALLPHLEPHPHWKACCMQVIGDTEIMLADYRSAITSLSIAVQLFIEVGDRTRAAACRRLAAAPHRILGETHHAEMLLNEARAVYAELGDEFEEAWCMMDLGTLMRMKNDYPAAIELLSVARKSFDTLQENYFVSRCSHILGTVYLSQGALDKAAVELEASRSAFISLGYQYQVAESTRFLGMVRREQGELLQADQLLGESELFYRDTGDRHGLAGCARQFGYLRVDQGRLEQARACFKAAHCLYVELQMQADAQSCIKCIQLLEPTA